MTREQFERLKPYTIEDARAGKVACYWRRNEMDVAKSLSVHAFARDWCVEWKEADRVDTFRFLDDLVRVYEEPAARITRSFWINVFPDGFGEWQHSEEDADGCHDGDRIGPAMHIEAELIEGKWKGIVS